MSKIKVCIEPLGKKIEVNSGTPLIDVVNEFGIEFPCGGQGICGGCKVKVLHGNIEADFMHNQFLETLRLEPQWRLACLSYVTEDITLEINQWESIILADNTNFAFEPQTGYGIAIDLGTTTLVAQLINLTNGQVVDVQTALNPQLRYGADIMSRIGYALKPNGAFELKQLIAQAINHLIQLLLNGKNIVPHKISIVGNTVMHHLLGGISVEPLSQYPFEPINMGALQLNATQINWNVPDNCNIIFHPLLGSFVGSDILAGIIAANIHKRTDLVALIDLGTNGEIVLGNKHGIVCASTAAGPAFEGTNISMGMKAATGAISAVTSVNNQLQAHVIGNTQPRGICGSGLIDAIAVLLKTEQIDVTGNITGGSDTLVISQPVCISQQDIREFQLAKAAIAAGLHILANKIGKTIADIDCLYIAGGFGNFINIENVIQLGLIEVESHKIHKLGNSALIGAKMLLYPNNGEVEHILNITKHISLESDKNFQDIYADKMFFF